MILAAAVTLVVVPIIIVYIFLQKYIIKGYDRRSHQGLTGEILR